jgi:hypothetical protein
MLLLEDRRFFVYALVDPRNNQVFYVGKGRDSRPLYHFKEAKRKTGKDSPKIAKIRKIWKCGLQPQIFFLKKYITEPIAFEIEFFYLKKLCFDLLTNISFGKGFGGDVYSNHYDKEGYSRKLSSANSNRYKNQENIKISKDASLTLWKNEEYAEKVRSGLRRAFSKPEVIKKLSDADKRYRERNPEKYKKEKSNAGKKGIAARKKKEELLGKGRLINKNGIVKRVYSSQLDSYLSEGWKLGMKENSGVPETSNY